MPIGYLQGGVEGNVASKRTCSSSPPDPNEARLDRLRRACGKRSALPRWGSPTIFNLTSRVCGTHPAPGLPLGLLNGAGAQHDAPTRQGLGSETSLNWPKWRVWNGSESGRTKVVCSNRRRQDQLGSHPGAKLKSFFHRCNPILGAFGWESTKETIESPLGFLLGG